jgi:lysophospholipase
VSAEAAPFFEDVAEAPGGVLCRWLHASDGVRLRAALWRAGGKGTVLLFPGRTEYIEKYGPAAAELRRRGYAMACIDWRGQGLADRLARDRMSGHVGRFTDYQRDIAALLEVVEAEGMPRPLFLMAHSMGGCIGLRALHGRLPVAAVAFSGPMWGIRIQPPLRPMAWASSTLARYVGQGGRYAPTTSPRTYVEIAAFEDNTLTRDPEMYDFMRRQVRAHPELALGGPSMRWLNEALWECRRLRQMPSPAYPCYTALGARERVVDTGAVHARMSAWLGGEIDLIPEAEHEVMMEVPAARARFYDRATALFDRQL